MPTFSSESDPNLTIEDYKSDSTLTFNDVADSTGSLTKCGSRDYIVVEETTDTEISWVKRSTSDGGASYVLKADPQGFADDTTVTMRLKAFSVDYSSDIPPAYKTFKIKVTTDCGIDVANLNAPTSLISPDEDIKYVIGSSADPRTHDIPYWTQNSLTGSTCIYIENLTIDPDPTTLSWIAFDGERQVTITDGDDADQVSTSTVFTVTSTLVTSTDTTVQAASSDKAYTFTVVLQQQRCLTETFVTLSTIGSWASASGKEMFILNSD